MSSRNNASVPRLLTEIVDANSHREMVMEVECQK